MSETQLQAKVMGVDPGFAAMGLSVVSGGRALDAWTVRTASVLPDGARFELLKGALIDWFHAHSVVAVICEDISGARQGGWQSGKTNSKAEHIRRVVGIAEGIAASEGVPFIEIKPHEWRKAVGLGRSSTNEQDKRAVRAITGWPGRLSGHAAAALAIAVAGERRLRIDARRMA